jgi:hypothetical protein
MKNVSWTALVQILDRPSIKPHKLQKDYIKKQECQTTTAGKN